MSRPANNLIGQSFGRLTVVERAENKGEKTYWKCLCDCGTECIVRGSHLINGDTKSCGCYSREIHSKHKMRTTKIYRKWRSVKDRCLNKKCSDYQYYGGRGITMYPAWIGDFQAFYDYVSTLEHFGEEGYTLDRIDNNGNYEPDNLRWADRKTQSRNKRNNRIVEYNGKLMTLADAAEKSGISSKNLSSRLRRGDTSERLFRPVKNH